MEQNIKESLEAAFGKELTVQQLWALVKLSKRVRKFCRSNAAFNNAFSRIFPNAQFRQVTKTFPPGHFKAGQTYLGLQITVNGQTVDETESDE